jgi:hypothetical protein
LLSLMPNVNGSQQSENYIVTLFPSYFSIGGQAWPWLEATKAKAPLLSFGVRKYQAVATLALARHFGAAAQSQAAVSV